MVSFSAKTSWVYALSLYSMLECRTEQPGTLHSQSVASGERESTVGSEHKTNILFYLHYKGFLYIFFNFIEYPHGSRTLLFYVYIEIVIQTYIIYLYFHLIMFRFALGINDSGFLTNSYPLSL